MPLAIGINKAKFNQTRGNPIKIAWKSLKDALTQVYFIGQILSVVPVRDLYQLSPATPHGCHDLRESMSRGCGQQMRELRHIHSKDGVKKTSC